MIFAVSGPNFLRFGCKLAGFAKCGCDSAGFGCSFAISGPNFTLFIIYNNNAICIIYINIYIRLSSKFAIFMIFKSNFAVFIILRSDVAIFGTRLCGI